MLIHLVRHGESEGNLASTLQGCRLDPPLSERGRLQAEALAERLAASPADLVVASPLRRARDTAEALAARHGLPIAIDPDLVEFDWGELTGRRFDEALEASLTVLRGRWKSGDVDLAPDGGESPRRVAGRAERVLERLADRGPRAPIVVAHGRFNRVLVTVLLGRELSRMDEVLQRNAALSVFEWTRGRPAEPLLLDDLAHLGADLISRSGVSDSLR